MYETIKDILFHSHNTRSEQIAEGWDRSYNLKMPIGPYTLSIGLGDGAYCAPRVALDDPTKYESVEAAILDSSGKLLSVRRVNDNFGPEVAKLCEGYGFCDDEDGLGKALANSGTVMPYITWDEVLMVANTIDKHSPDIEDLM